MRHTMIQNTICRSRLLLPCSCALAVALWCLPPTDEWRDRGIGFALCAVIAYFLTETCNSNSLIRVYTRSVSSLFIVSAACLGFMHDWQPTTIAALCLVAGEYMILRADRRKSHIADTFHIFATLGLGCLFVPQLAVLAPFYYWFIVLMLRSFSFRAFWAGVIGLTLPGLVAAGICLATERTAAVAEWCADLITLYPIDPDNYLGVDQLTAGCWIALAALALWCGKYFANKIYHDKARVRSLFQIIYMQTAIVAIVAGLQPQHAPDLLPAMLGSTAPCAAHYFTLSDTRLCAAVFVATLLLLCCGALLTLTDDAIDIASIIGITLN